MKTLVQEKEKATALGIDISNIDENEIINLIFEDSFPTKDEVTDLSGRGVGLASIKEECEKLGIKINVESKKDEGTTFEFIIFSNI
jgi:two-component system chemotaxis sensor kinase CheA